ncbi:MAG: Rho termination factor N-terminal domain-containing protein, partial [Planctomycetota bacterium]
MSPRQSSHSSGEGDLGRGTRSGSSRTKKTRNLRRGTRGGEDKKPTRRKKVTKKKTSLPPIDLEGLPMDVEDLDEIPQTVSGKMPELHLSEMHKMTMAELQEMSREEGIEEIAGLKKQDLIFVILKNRAEEAGVMYGEGVLEVLPDGFGFLRSPRYSYYPCADDIYVSPSQIRRFGLVTGCVIQGQVRPPKEGERYFALLQVDAINYENTEKVQDIVVFDDLTPLYPDDRLIMETETDIIETRIIDLVTP